MRRISFGLGLIVTFVFLSSAPSALAQAPSVIQVFMPGGAMPDRVIRLTLIFEDGFMDTVFTDSKGKYEIRTPGNQ